MVIPENHGSVAISNSKMSYHGPRDNGEGRPRHMNHHVSRSSGAIEPGSTTEATPDSASSSPSIITTNQLN